MSLPLITMAAASTNSVGLSWKVEENNVWIIYGLLSNKPSERKKSAAKCPDVLHLASQQRNASRWQQPPSCWPTWSTSTKAWASAWEPWCVAGTREDQVNSLYIHITGTFTLVHDNDKFNTFNTYTMISLT